MEILGFLVIVTGLFGVTFSDEQIIGCPVGVDDELRVDSVVILEAVKCLVPGGGDGPNVDFLYRRDATDEARVFFQGYCGSSAPIRRCLDGFNDVWEKCHAEDEKRRDFGLIRDFLDTSLEVSCADNGETLVRIYQELQPNRDNPDHHVGMLEFMQDCMQHVGLNFLSGGDGASIPVRVFGAYARMKFLRRCFRDHGRDLFVSTHEIDALFGKIAHKMKCLHPSSGAFVLCSSLNEEGNGDRECPRRFANMDRKHVGQRLVDDGFQCFFPPVDIFGKTLPREVAETAIGELVVDYCWNLTAVKDCLGEVTSSARTCLGNATRRDVFEMFQEMLETSLEIACSNATAVAPLTRILFGNYERASSSDEDVDVVVANVVGQCLDVVVTKIKHVPDDVATDDDTAAAAAATSMLMYREVGAFHECLVRDVDQDTLKLFADTFLNEVLDKIKCASPDGGQPVPCKNIVDNF